MKPTLIMNSTRVLANMDKLRQRTPHASSMAMSRACEMLRGYIVSRKLSGQVLKRQTGRLAGSIEKEVISKKGEIIGRVGSNLKYARVHEKGINKMVSVKEHVRSMYGQSVTVRSHRRHMIVTAKRYIEYSIREYRPQLQKILGQTFWTEVTSG